MPIQMRRLSWAAFPPAVRALQACPDMCPCMPACQSLTQIPPCQPCMQQLEHIFTRDVLTLARATCRQQVLSGLQCLDDCRAHEWGLPSYKLERSRMHIKLGHMHPAANILESVIVHLRDNGSDGLDSMLWEAKVSASTPGPLWPPEGTLHANCMLCSVSLAAYSGCVSAMSSCKAKAVNYLVDLPADLGLACTVHP